MSSVRPIIPDPSLVPVIDASLHGLAVPSELLSTQWVRQRFAVARSWQPEMTGDRNDRPSGILRPASVLVLIVERPTGLTVLLTERTAHLNDHPGQISFPGGRADPGDVDAVATALRETHEEVGVPPSSIEVVGCLPHYVTITGYQVTPVVALASAPLRVEPDPFEVAEAFEVPLAFLLDPANHQRRGGDLPNLGRRGFLAMPYRPVDRPGKEFFIWGATAAMLRNLYCFLSSGLEVLREPG